MNERSNVPTVGRIVHWKRTGTGAPFPALVTAVSGQVLCLAVFEPGATNLTPTTATASFELDGPEDTREGWMWPTRSE